MRRRFLVLTGVMLAGTCFVAAVLLALDAHDQGSPDYLRPLLTGGAGDLLLFAAAGAYLSEPGRRR